MFRHVPLIIPLVVKRFWDKWNIPGAVLFSLWLQMVLVFVASFRKSARSVRAISLIWSAYLLADAAADFAVGLISNSQRDQSNNQPKPTESTDLLAFWAPFLLLHLGGPDTITAFALEDNELWGRHLLTLGFQAVTVLYVFYQSLPNHDLWVPTVLMITAGIIKYAERTLALCGASLDNFRDSFLQPSDPGPNYAKFMTKYASMREARVPTRIHMTPEPDKETKASYVAPKERELNHLQVVYYAHHFFQKFKGLFVDLIFSFRERDQSRDFFNRRTAEDALRVIEVELNFLYGTLYTKVEVVHSIAGYIFRFLAFGSVLAALGIFHFQAKKDEFHGVDIRITYTLLLGAIALDVTGFLMLIFSDRMISDSVKIDRPHRCSIAAIFSLFLALKKPWWYACKCKRKNSGGQEMDQVQHNVLITPLLFRRWSGSVSAHNLIRYCLESSKTRIHEFPSLREIVFEKFLCLLRSNEVTEKVLDCMTEVKLQISQCCESIGSRCSIISKHTGFSWLTERVMTQIFRPFRRRITELLPDFVDEMMYVSREPFIKELWEFIFDELKNKSEFADTPETAKRISSARGDWVLTDTDSQMDWSKLLKYLTDVPYDESLLLWHIATDLCYYTDGEKVKKEDGSYVIDKENEKLKSYLTHGVFSKILSDYMLYLLVFQPTMMSAVAGIGKIRFRDSLKEAQRFFEQRKLRSKDDMRDVCEGILSVNTEVEPVTVKGDRSKSVLFDASILAKELNRLELKDKWKLMSRVWVELVSYAASHCRASTHAQRLCQGGELITFVWLLMAHFGLGEQFQIIDKHARAKLVVGK